jgi:hypothetical protein
MARKRGPNLLQGIGGFGLSFANGIATQWNRMGKSERDKYDSVFDYVRGKEKGATGGAQQKPVSAKDKVADLVVGTQMDQQASNMISPSEQASPVDNQSFSQSISGDSATAQSSPVDLSSGVEEQSLPDTSYDEELRKMQQQAQQESQQYSSSFNDYSSGGSYGS